MIKITIIKKKPGHLFTAYETYFHNNIINQLLPVKVSIPRLALKSS